MRTSWLAGEILGGGMEVICKVEPRRPFGGVFNRTGSLEGPPLAQPGRHQRHGSHEPVTLREAVE